MDDIPDDLVTLKEAHQRFGVAVDTVRRWARENKVRRFRGSARPGGGSRRVLVSAAEVEAHYLHNSRLRRESTSADVLVDTAALLHSSPPVQQVDPSAQVSTPAAVHQRALEEIDLLRDEIADLRDEADQHREQLEAQRQACAELEQQALQAQAEAKALRARLEAQAETHAAQLEALQAQVELARMEGAKTLAEAREQIALTARDLEQQRGEKQVRAAEATALVRWQDQQGEQLAEMRAERDDWRGRHDQLRAELEAYRRWAGRGALSRAFGRPELPPAPSAPWALPEPDHE